MLDSGTIAKALEARKPRERLESQNSQVVRHEARGRLFASLAVAKHRCETHSFCDKICTSESEMVFFAGMGKNPYFQEECRRFRRNLLFQDSCSEVAEMLRRMRYRGIAERSELSK